MEKPTWTRDVLKYIVDPPSWLPIIILVVLIVALFIIHKRSYNIGKVERKKYEDEWNELAGVRDRLRNLTGEAYERWVEANDLRQTVETAIFPIGVPVGKRKNLMDWLSETSMGGWTDSSGHLLNFVQNLYPVEGESKLFELPQYQMFHEARKRLSKHWDALGRAILREKNVALHDFKSIIISQKNNIKMLSYLECALAARYRDPGPGKEWMFKLYKKVCR